MGLNLLILTVLFVMALVIKNHAGLEKSNIFKKAFTLIIVMYQTFLSTLIFDVLIRTLVSASEPTTPIAF
jgi:hypothetical protein